jgi:hypothetical protein
MLVMNPTVITYLGFFVATLIILWAGIELGRRFYKHKKIDARVMNSWLPLESSTAAETEDAQVDDDTQADMPPRAQQNGHYSESKKI